MTYFEFTTLAIMGLMAASKLDLAILEVGLGGRLDAVNIVDADCAVITSIDLDHMDYLGPDRESIGREKAGIMRTGRPAIVSDPVPPQSVLDRAEAIGADLWRLGRDFNFSGDKQQWAWAGRGRRYAGLAYPALRGANQLINASGALAALEALRQPSRSRRRRCAMAWPWSNCRDASRSCRASRRWCSTWRTTRIRWPRWRQSRCDGLLSDHARRVRRDGGQGPGAHAREVGPLIDRWYFTDLPTPRAASAAEPLREVAGAEQARPMCRRSTYPDPDGRPCGRRWPLQTPLIESSSSDRSTPWAAF